MLSFTAKRPDNIGVQNGILAPIPDSPNAVATQSGIESQKMMPIEFGERSAIEMMEQIEQVINSQPRTRIVEQTDNYLHAEFSSLIFRFTDDVEFFVDQDAKLVHFRSASRVGYSDMGANRSRMEMIVKLLSN